MTLVNGMKHRQESPRSFLALSALRDKVAEIQDTANLPQKLENQEGVGAVYAKYHGQTFTVCQLPSSEITVICFADETSVPGYLGGPQDLNFDGDPDDNLDNV